VVDGLVDRGYVLREAVPGDRRSGSIVVTPEGRNRLKTAEDAMSVRLEQLLGAVSDRDAFVRGLAEIDVAMRSELQARLEATLAARR